MGLTKEGYIRRTYDDILNSLIQRAKELFGEDIDTSDLSTFGKYLRIIAYDEAIAEEEIEAVYYSSKPNTASGQSLDRLLVFGGIKRNQATEASYLIEIQGTAGYTIPAGFLVGTDMGHTFYTVGNVTISDDGVAEVEAACTVAGIAGNVVAGAITKIINPDANVDSVQGKTCTSLGVAEENDVDLRTRLTAALQGSGSCNENSLRSALLRIPTVQFAAVIANDSDEEDSSGRPPHSFECYIRGGDQYEKEIGDTIFDKKPIGIKTTGDKSVTVKDASGTEHTIYYSPTYNVEVIVKASVKVANTFPEDGVTQIKNSVASHINNLGIGKSLIMSSIYAPLYGVTGVAEVYSLELSTDGGSSYTSANVNVSQFELAVCKDVLLDVEVIST